MSTPEPGTPGGGSPATPANEDSPAAGAGPASELPDAQRPDGSPASRGASRPDGEVATDSLGATSAVAEIAHKVAAGPNAVTATTVPRAGSDLFGATFGSDTSGMAGLVRPPRVETGTARPYGSWFDEAVDALVDAYAGFGDHVTRVVVDRDELTLHVKPEHVADLARHLRDSPDHRYELLSNLSGVDYPDTVTRLHVVYNLTSMTYRRRIRLETAVTVEDPKVATVTGVYPTADYHERETWDFFGVVFDGHPALTRIFMPDDWVGHPQRKDYPLGGIAVEYKGATIPPPDERRTYA